ncbi:class I SAM-dependent methyltransferase [Candidatus Pelagibacter sp.]|nr:class I SAM-dependent methyltransferase [Candidatus Pelagibacter sp.]
MIYFKKKSCRLCKSKNIIRVFNLGKFPIGDDYTKKKNKNLKIPLKVMACKSCGFKQLSVVVDEKKVYGDYLYTTKTSHGLQKHFKKNFKFIKKFKKNLKKNDLILDIGSNDGTNLEIFKKNKFDIIGVEPSNSLSKIANKNKIKTINEPFNLKAVNKILHLNKKPKIICIYNTLANIDNLDSFVKNLLKLMTSETLVIIESFSLLGIIKNNLFDSIYHEHLSYFHLGPLKKYFKKFDLNIVYVENNEIKGGSIKIILSKKKTKTNNLQIKKCIKIENKYKLNKLYIFDSLIKKNTLIKTELNKILSKYKNKIVAGYGASCGTTIFIYYYGLNKIVNFIFDDEPKRNGLYSPASNIPVYNPKIRLIKKVDLILLISWRYSHIIIKKYKQNYSKKINIKKEFLIPMPKIKKIMI